MTTKEMLKKVIDGDITDEVKEKATEVLASYEKKNNKRAEKSAENRSANSVMATAIANKMQNRTYAVAEIMPLIAEDYPDTTKAKVSAVMAVGVDDGLFTVVNDYKVGGKGRKVNGYTKIVTEDNTENDTEDNTENDTEDNTEE